MPSDSKRPAPPDRRAAEIRHLDMVYTMPVYKTKEEWLARKEFLRQQILVSCGLWPMPERTSLKAKVFGKMEYGDYTVEKVYMQVLPGFYLCGNLYRPKGKMGPFPGILSPHGHWRTGRLEHQDLGSIPGRCIGLARRGCVAFAYDMIGYNDTNQVPHNFGGRREALWGISLMGLQLWDSIRAVDFLCSLPDVDKDRIGCTGASGGGTQTFMLTAVDDRVKVSVPAVMISAHMQGGCLCENAPGLRIGTNNVEIGAMMAPRPMLMIAATGDWTKNTATVEYPAIHGVYKLFGAGDNLDYKIFNAPHNYNKDSREAMYAWFLRWFLGVTDPTKAREAPFNPPQPRDLLVFYGMKRPKGFADAQALTDYLISSAKAKVDALKPTSERTLERFRETMGVALQRALAVELPGSSELIISEKGSSLIGGYEARQLTLGRRGKGDGVPAILLMPRGASARREATVVVHPLGKEAIVSGKTQCIASLAERLLEKGHLVLTIDCFASGESERPTPDPKLKYLDTYNRTETANRVQDILTAVAYLRGRDDTAAINLVGLDEAGLWCLLARPFAPAVGRLVADAAQFNTKKDDEFLEQLYVPGLRRAGDFRTALALSAPGEIFIHNTGRSFSTAWAADVYRSLKISPLLRIGADRASVAETVNWLTRCEGR